MALFNATRVLKTKGYRTNDRLSGFMRKRVYASELHSKSSQETLEDQSSDDSKSDQEDDADVNIDVESLGHIVLDSSDFSFKGMDMKKLMEPTAAIF